MKAHHEKIGYLETNESVQLLQKCKRAHLACQENGEIYIVPVAYFYDDNFIYCHSRPGKKIEVMRKSPKICLQVEEVKDMYSWKSVLVWGEFEELTGDKAVDILKLLAKKMTESEPVTSLDSQPFMNSETSIIFRMKIKKMTGRYEGINQLI